jgi:hypothetical protein
MAAAIPGARLEILPRAAHFPHLDDPAGLAEAIERFMAETEPRPVADERWGQIVRSGPPLTPGA